MQDDKKLEEVANKVGEKLDASVRRALKSDFEDVLKNNQYDLLSRVDVRGLIFL